VAEFRLSPEQAHFTRKGNLCLKLDHVLGKHFSQFGERDLGYYETLVDSVHHRAAACTAMLPEQARSTQAEQVSETYEILLSLAEGAFERKQRLRDDRDAYAAQCVTFFEAYARLKAERDVDRQPQGIIHDRIHDSSARESVARIDPASLIIDPERFGLPDRALYFKEKGARLMDEVLVRHGRHIETVVNVGARVDHTSYFLAKRYPEVKFLSVDFPFTLREQNEAAFGSLPDNMHFAAGYALDMFAAGLKADVVFMMGAGLLFTAGELRAYAAAFHKAGVKIVVLNEPWASPLHAWDLGWIPAPEDVDPDAPYLGGTALNSHHNYPAMLEAAGYRIGSSRIIDDHLGGWSNILQLTAFRG
jgi:hypothetical protein